MISWVVLFYGAALSAIAVAAVLWFAGREHAPGTVAVATAAATAAVIGWNSILQVTAATQFFTDLPGRVFPVSWQDFGSGVFATAATAVVLGFGPHRDSPARRVATLAVLAGAAALAVDMYLY